MEAEQILHAHLLDLLFEGRNKAYGAYQLRATYRRRLITAVCVMCSLLLLLTAAGLLANHAEKTNTPLMLDDIHLLPDVPPPAVEKVIPPPVVPPAAHQQAALARFTSITPVLDPAADAPILEQASLDDTQIGTIDRDGIKGADLVAPPVEQNGTGAMAAPPVHNEDFLTEVAVVQIQAKFPGGDQEWRKYLERNLNRDLPIENGAAPGQYKVIVSFLVNKEGHISEVRAENDPGYGIGQEAVRVIKKGPAWIPAVQNGRNVVYRQKQSIIFEVARD